MDAPTESSTTPRLAYTCPHCSGVLDLTPLVSPPSTAASAADPPTPRFGQAQGMLDRGSPLVDALRQVMTPGSLLPGVVRWLRGWLSALLLLFLLGVLIWQQWVASAASAEAPALMTPHTSTTLPDRAATDPVVPDHAAVLAVVAAYNAAEAEVAQTLDLTPLLPLLAPDNPLAQRRAQEIAQRQRTHAIHATRLLRWAVGAITIDPARTTATVTTQETWDDQVGSQLSRTATVRVVYTLRRADTQSAWRIADAQSTLL